MMLFIFLLWIILNGQITVEIVLFGLAFTALISLFAWKVMHYTPVTDIRFLKNIALLAVYVLDLVWEIIKASLLVMKDAVRPTDELSPVIVEFDSGFDSDFKNVLLANSITLTPGTYTLFEDNGHFVIHCLKKEYSEGLDDSSFVKLLKKIDWSLKKRQEAK